MWPTTFLKGHSAIKPPKPNSAIGPARPYANKKLFWNFGGLSGGGEILQFCKFQLHFWHWIQFCLVASQQWLGGCKVRAGNRSIDGEFRLAWNGWGVIESWKWHLLIALIQSCFTANWVWIWDLDSVSDLRWHVCKLLSTAGLWRLAVKLKVFLTYSSFRKSNSGVGCFLIKVICTAGGFVVKQPGWSCQ